MELTQTQLDQFLAPLPDSEEPTKSQDSKKIVESDGLIERTTLIEKKLIIEDGRQLLVEERPITHSEIL